MYSNKISALIALPIMAAFIALIAFIPYDAIGRAILEKGPSFFSYETIFNPWYKINDKTFKNLEDKLSPEKLNVIKNLNSKIFFSKKDLAEVLKKSDFNDEEISLVEKETPFTPGREIITVVLEKGTWKLHIAIITVLFGSMLGQLINRTGIAKSLIKKTAELAGDKPLMIAISMTLVIALLFTVLGGLGAIIMVATIVFPIMLSIGITPMIAGCLFLLGLSLGGAFNFVNWQLYIDVLGLSQSDIISFAAPFGIFFFLIIIAFIIIEFKRENISLELFSYSFKSKPPSKFKKDVDVDALLKEARKKKNITEEKIPKKAEDDVPWYALFTPIIPLVLVFGFKIYNIIVKPEMPFDFPIIPALMAGIIYGVITTKKKNTDSINVLTKSIFEGISLVAPAVALMIGIGMVVTAVMHESVRSVMAPLITFVMPTNAVYYIIFFTICAPMALYRGPLNIWGLGSGLIALMVSTGSIGAGAVMGALFSVGMIQGVCDPTNTHNVWIANFLALDIQKILKKTIVYMWVLAILGLFMAGIRYF